MATESIGSIGLSVEIEDVNVKKVTEAVAEALNETEKAAEDLGKAVDNMADEIEKATSDAGKSAATMGKDINKALDNIDAKSTTEELKKVNEQISETTKESERTTEGMQSIGAQIKAVKNQMEQLALAGEAESEQYKELLNQLGQLLDIKGDIAAQGAIFSDDDMNIKALNQGVSTYQSSLGLLGDTLGMVAGSENAVGQAASALNDIQKVGNTIQGIQNALNQDGYIKRVLLTKVTETQTRVQNSLTKAFGGTARAAKMAEIATKGLTIAAAAATVGLPFLIMAIEKLIEKWQEAKEQQNAIFEGVGDSVGETVAKIRDLQSQWNALGDDLKKKKKFVEENKDSFEDLGVSIENVNDAENLLVNNTEVYIQALMARAKANAAQGVLNDKYSALIKERAELEQEVAEHEEALRKAQEKKKTDTKSGINWDKQIEVEQAWMAKYREDIKKQEEEFNKDNLGLINTIKQAQADAERFARESGVKEIDNKNKKDKGSKSTKEAAAEELTEYQRLKEALKEYQDLKAAGYDPKLFEKEQRNLEKQIEDYERLHHLVELPKANYSERIAKMKEFSEKLVSIAEQARDTAAEIENDENLSSDEKKEKLAQVLQFRESDIEMLKAEYGVVGENLTDAIIEGMKENINIAQGDIATAIIDIKREIETLSNQTDGQGNQQDNSEKIAVLQGRLQNLDSIYKKLKKDISETTKESKKSEAEFKAMANERIKKGIADLAAEFVKLGDQIGGRAGDALNFVGNLTNVVMDTISNIQRFSEITSKSIEGVSKATATAIKAVESASVILAIISAAMEITMQLVQLFQKDKETYEDKKEVYDAYVSTLDTIIDRERKLTETLEAQQAVAQYDAIGDMIEKQEESTRRIAKDYLNSRNKGEHTKGVQNQSKMNSNDWNELSAAIGASAANKVKAGGRLTDIFDLSAEDLKKIQTQATGFYSKLDQETRQYIDKIISYDDAMAQNVEDKMTQLNNVSFDEFSNNFVNALMDMDASAEDISKSIQDQMRQALIQDMFKEQYAGRLKEYYEKWAKAMENGDISSSEQRELDTLRESIVSGASAAAKAINDQFRDTTEEIEDEEGGLSGAIKGASQESIDLLTGQTNAVRMNQVEAMALAREQLNAVFNIDKNLTNCVNILKDIRSDMQGSNNNFRSQGLDI